VVPFLILGGLGLLWAFAEWEERQERLGRDSLLKLPLLRIPSMRAGLSSLFMQQVVLLGTFFVLPVFLQVVLGLDAFETGVRLIPMSVAMLVAALLGPGLAARQSPKRVAQVGLVALAIGAAILVGTIDYELVRIEFSIGLAIFGTGAGLLASQLGNVIMSSVNPSDTNEAGGLQGTAQNLGSSFGTALMGAILLSGLAGAFVERVATNPALPPELRATISEAVAAGGLEVVPADQLEAAALDAGLSPEEASAVTADYADAQLEGLQNALGAVAIFATLGLWFARRLPAKPFETAD
ncbi:MAG TPA: MFS transporter, partial [Candidatus Limnocylindria bacterium]